MANLHMNQSRQLVTCAVLLCLLFTVGCVKKKPKLPSQAQAPAEPIASPLPGEISEAIPPPALPPPAPKPTHTEEPPPKPVKPHHTKKKPAPSTTPAQAAPPASSASTTPANNAGTVAALHPPANPAGEAPDIAIAADVSSAQLNRQKQSTAQLLDETEKTISGLNHSLSHEEEEMLGQIRSYVTQSRKATSDGDFERAYNLATKAHLLSDALVKK
jgi:outer membrane biosynthesis protein TonB